MSLIREVQAYDMQRVLVLTGPAGTAKSSTIRVLSQELKFEIIEWKSSTSESFTNATGMSFLVQHRLF